MTDASAAQQQWQQPHQPQQHQQYNGHQQPYQHSQQQQGMQYQQQGMQQQQYQPSQQPQPQQAQPQQSLPFPTLMQSNGAPPVGAAPVSWGSAGSSAPFPHILPATLATGPPAGLGASASGSAPFQAVGPQRQASPTPLQQPPRLAAHVPVPAALLAHDDDGPPPLEPAHAPHTQHSYSHGPSSAGHSHDGQACSHSHGGASSPSHSHSHAHSNVHSHAHAQPSSPSSFASSSSSSAHSAHGHSHGNGASCSSDHGHSHGTSVARKAPPSVPSWDEPARPTGPLRRRVMRWLGLAWRSGGDSRAVLTYIGLKLSVMLVQLWWGLLVGNHGMVSSSFHTCFDILALLCSLFAMLSAKYPPRHPFSYGSDRQEVVAAFTQAVFLFFVATFMIIETFHTAYSPPELEYADVCVAFLGLGVDAVGIVFFAKYMALGRQVSAEEALQQHQASHVWGGAGAVASSAGNSGSALLLGANGARGHYENMHGVSLHVLADLVGHASLLGAVWFLASYPSFPQIFALSFLASAVLMIRLVLPLFQSTAAILLMTTPAHLRLALDRAIREISFYDGVLEMRAAHWWTHAPGLIVGSMHVRIRADANEQQILAYVHGVLSKFCAKLTVQVEKDQMPNNWITQHANMSP